MVSQINNIQITVENRLKQLASMHSVKLLFAAETGPKAKESQLQDTPSQVRFIYVRDKTEYLSVTEYDDVIQLPAESSLEVTGWDLKKLLQNAGVSHPPIHEWFSSSLVFYQDDIFSARIKALISEYYSTKRALGYYLGLAKGAYAKISDWEEARFRTTLETLHALLTANWIAEKGEAPPLDLKQLIEILDENSKKAVRAILNKRLYLSSKSYEPIDSSVIALFEKLFAKCKLHEKTLTHERKSLEKLDLFFYNTIMQDL